MAEKNQTLKEEYKASIEAKETANLEFSKATSIFEYKSLSEHKEVSKDDIKPAEISNSIKDYVFSDKLKEEFSDKDFAKDIITGDKIDTKSADINNFSGVIPQIPEPETYMMLLVGLMLVGLTHKKSRKSKFNSIR